MEHCQYEHEIKRIIKLLDGNSRGGLTRDVIEINKEQINMCTDIKDLKETSQLQATAINGFVRYQAENQVVEDYKKEERKLRRQMTFFLITQSMAIIALVLSLIFK
jgi:hypothetical protein